MLLWLHHMLRGLGLRSPELAMGGDVLFSIGIPVGFWMETCSRVWMDAGESFHGCYNQLTVYKLQ